MRKAIKIDEEIHQVLESIYSTQEKMDGSKYTNKTDLANDLLIEALKSKGLWLQVVAMDHELYKALGIHVKGPIDQTVHKIVMNYLETEGISFPAEG